MYLDIQHSAVITCLQTVSFGQKRVVFGRQVVVFGGLIVVFGG